MFATTHLDTAKCENHTQNVKSSFSFSPFQATSHPSAVSYKYIGEPRGAFCFFYQKLTFVNKIT